MSSLRPPTGAGTDRRPHDLLVPGLPELSGRNSLWRRVDPTLVALTVLALAAASIRLDAKSLWLDEAVSVTHARLGLSGLWGVVSGGDPNMGLYYVALHVWVDLFGYGETSVRLLSVLLGALAIPAIYL